MMNFLKSLVRQEEPRPVERGPATANELATRSPHAAALRLSKQDELAILDLNEIVPLHLGGHLATRFGL